LSSKFEEDVAEETELSPTTRTSQEVKDSAFSKVYICDVQEGKDGTFKFSKMHTWPGNQERHKEALPGLG